MSREIKFQVWDLLKKEMITESDRCQIDLNGKVIDWYNEDEFGHEGRYVIRQYTGATDKYGDPIYEGDIVNSGLLTGAVVMRNGSWCFGGHPLYNYTEDIRVRGSIYETPELLNR